MERREVGNFLKWQLLFRRSFNLTKIGSANGTLGKLKIQAKLSSTLISQGLALPSVMSQLVYPDRRSHGRCPKTFEGRLIFGATPRDRKRM